MKYLVMECNPAYAVVLGDDGVFQKVANMRYQVGQTVTGVVPLKLPEVAGQPKTNHRRWVSTLAAMAACLTLVLTSVFFAGQMPYASVYMAINPEVRIDVNRFDRVVGVEGMNADGAALLRGYDHKRKALDTVMDELVDRAVEQGYLHEGGKITLSLDGNEEWIVSHSNGLNRHLNEHLTDKITVTIDIVQKQPEPAPPTAPTGIIVIPVGPGDYGDSDYDDGESDYDPANAADSGYGLSDYDGEDGQSDYDAPDSGYASTGADNSGYGQSDYGDSGYDEPEEAEQTDYDAAQDSSDYEQADSGYEASDYGSE